MRAASGRRTRGGALQDVLIGGAIGLEHLAVAVIMLYASPASRAGSQPARCITQQRQCRMGERFGIGDAHDDTARAQCLVFTRQAFDQFLAGADIGRHDRDPCRHGFQQYQRQAFADGRQHGQADFRQQRFHVLQAQEPYLVGQAQAGGQRLAFKGISGIFFLRAGNPGFGLGQAVDDDAHGADEGLHVLDRHDTTDQAEHGRDRFRPVQVQGLEFFDIDSVWNAAGFVRLRAILDLPLPVGFEQRHDLVGRAVAHASQ